MRGTVSWQDGDERGLWETKSECGYARPVICMNFGQQPAPPTPQEKAAAHAQARREAAMFLGFIITVRAFPYAMALITGK